MKSKILVISPLPPPVYGSNLSCQTCLDVIRESGEYDVQSIKLNVSQPFCEVGRLRWSKLHNFFRLVRETYSYLRKFDPDLVYFMPASSGFAFYRDFILVALVCAFRKPVKFHLRTRFCCGEKAWNIKQMVFRRAFRNHSAIVLGKELVGEIEPYFDPKKISIVPNAIANPISDSDLDEVFKYRLTRKKLHLVFLSNMMREKGWEKALFAARILKEKQIDFTLKFAGAWPSPDEEVLFGKLVRENNLDNEVSYLGLLNDPGKDALLRESDLMIFPTEYRYETFGRVIIEGMAYGVPALASNIATIPTTISDRSTGFLLYENTPEEIAGIIEKSIDKEKLNTMGTAARKKFLREYELHQFKERFLAALRSR